MEETNTTQNTTGPDSPSVQATGTDQSTTDSGSDIQTTAPIVPAAPIVYPIVTTTEESDGSTKVTTEDEDGMITWQKSFPDGKKIDMEASGYEVTRYTNGDLQYTSKNGKDIYIRAGNGEDVIKARRSMRTGHNEESFMRGMIAQLTKFDGKFVPHEAIPAMFKTVDYIFLEMYFKEVNF